jgi:hypothetical protein
MEAADVSRREFIRAWYDWQRVAVPVEAFRQGHSGAPTYQLELDLDHLRSSVYSIGTEFVAGTQWSWTALAGKLLRNLDSAELEANRLELTHQNAEPYRVFTRATRRLLLALVTAAEPDGDSRRARRRRASRGTGRPAPVSLCLRRLPRRVLRHIPTCLFLSLLCACHPVRRPISPDSVIVVVGRCYSLTFGTWRLPQGWDLSLWEPLPRGIALHDERVDPRPDPSRIEVYSAAPHFWGVRWPIGAGGRYAVWRSGGRDSVIVTLPQSWSSGIRLELVPEGRRLRGVARGYYDVVGQPTPHAEIKAEPIRCDRIPTPAHL